MAKFDATELQRASLALAHLVSLDCVAVGGEFLKDGWLTAHTSDRNALHAVLRKPETELTRDDALLCAAVCAPLAAAQPKGLDPVLNAAGQTFMGHFVPGVATLQGRIDEERDKVLSSLTAAALREARDQLPEGLIAGAWCLLFQLHFLRPSIAQHQIEIGCIDLAVAELRTMPSDDWLSVSRCPSGRAAMAMTSTAMAFIGLPDPGTSGLLDVCVEALAAYEQAGASADTSASLVFMTLQAIDSGRLVTTSAENATLFRSAASSLRFVLDNPMSWCSEMGYSTGQIGGILAVEAFGRDEAPTSMDRTRSDIIQLHLPDIHNILLVMSNHLSTSPPFGGTIPLQPHWSEALRNLCVSDHHKALLLGCQQAIPHLLSGLFLAADHPRGLQSQEILGPQAVPTPTEVQAVYQLAYAEALAQLALFPAGKTALLTFDSADGSVVASLEAVVERGLSDEAQEFARTALMALRGFADVSDDVKVAEHIMLSYEWDVQATIVRINASLVRHGYVTWLDVEKMKGSIMDA